LSACAALPPPPPPHPLAVLHFACRRAASLLPTPGLPSPLAPTAPLPLVAAAAAATAAASPTANWADGDGQAVCRLPPLRRQPEPVR